jgi:hypothetical protein
LENIDREGLNRIIKGVSVKENPLIPDSVSGENLDRDQEKIKTLLIDHMGLRGLRTLIMGIFTVLPYLIGLKISMVAINISAVSLIFLAYHGCGIVTWWKVGALRRVLRVENRRVLLAINKDEADYSDIRLDKYEREQVNLAHRWSKAAGFLTVPVIASILAIFLAKIETQWNGKLHKLKFPPLYYEILGVPDADLYRIEHRDSPPSAIPEIQ